MAIEIKFSMLCEKRFNELPGDDQVTRYCNSCKTQVINLDSLNEVAKQNIVDIVLRDKVKLCVASTQPVESATPCGIYSVMRPLMGAVQTPEAKEKDRIEYEKQLAARSEIQIILEQEQERLEPGKKAMKQRMMQAEVDQLKQRSKWRIFSKLKFW